MVVTRKDLGFSRIYPSYTWRVSICTREDVRGGVTCRKTHPDTGSGRMTRRSSTSTPAKRTGRKRAPSSAKELREQPAQKRKAKAGPASGMGEARGQKVCIVFEGRDGAGKGGTIKAITDRVSPRIFRVVALPAPTERRSRRCTSSATCRICRPRGEVVIFDRSWYNRAGVERVMGFCRRKKPSAFSGRASRREGRWSIPASSCSSTGSR